MENLEPNTRLFIVAGKSVDENVLTEAFREFGTILSVKVVKEKGVAYINYEKASSAAMAIETMHERILQDGRGPMVKVMFAEAPKSGQGKRGGNGSGSGDLGGTSDPDNVPPQSRLFIVVPKTSDGALIESEMAKFNDLEYCKTDLIAAKGIVFCKYGRTSSALRALEAVQENGMLANYKVKCMLAEPKGKRGRQEFSGYSDPASPSYQAPSMSFDHVALQQAASLASNFSTGSYLGGYPVSPSHSAFSGASEARAPSLQSAWQGQGPYQAAFGAVPPSNFHDLWNNLPPQAPPPPGPLPAQAEMEASRANRYLLDLQTDALAKGSLNMNAAAARGAINLDRSQPLDHVELAALAQKISKDGLAGMDFSPHTVSALLENYSSAGAPPNPSPAAPSQGGQASNSGASPQPPREGGFPMEAHEAVQLVARVPLDASEREITQLFNSVPGLMSCRLIIDPGSGFAMGFASIWYSSPAAASQALYRLGGVSHRGETIQVAVASPEAVANALHPVRTSSVISDSNDAYLRRHTSNDDREEAPESRHRSSPLEQVLAPTPPPMAPPLQQPATELQIHKTEVAAVQNSLSHLSMPQRPESPRGPILSEAFQKHLPQLKPRRQLSSRQLSNFGPEPEGEAESQTLDPSLAPNAQQRTVWTVLNRPLPTYALQHYFSSTCGPVQGVKLFADERYGAVTFLSEEAAQKALLKRNTSDICGESLTVLPEDPRMMRNKRARRGL